MPNWSRSTPEEKKRKYELALAEGRTGGAGAGPGHVFKPGYDPMRVVHGATVPQHIQPRATEILNLLKSEITPDYLKDPSYWLVLKDLAWTEAKIEILEAYIEEKATVEETFTEYVDSKEITRGSLEEGEIRKKAKIARRQDPSEQLRRWKAHAQKLRVELGLTPLSRARLGKDIASAKLDLAQLWAEDGTPKQ